MSKRLWILTLIATMMMLAPIGAQATSPPTSGSGIDMVASTSQTSIATADIATACSSPPTAISRGAPTTGSFSSIMTLTAPGTDAVQTTAGQVQATAISTSNEQARAPDDNAMAAASMDQKAGPEADVQYQKLGAMAPTNLGKGIRVVAYKMVAAGDASLLAPLRC